jgi:hypothetical protein
MNAPFDLADVFCQPACLSDCLFCTCLSFDDKLYIWTKGCRMRVGDLLPVTVAVPISAAAPAKCHALLSESCRAVSLYPYYHSPGLRPTNSMLIIFLFMQPDIR